MTPSSRDFDPLRLDVAAFAKAQGRLEGRWPMAALERLAASVPPGASTDAIDVTWSARGEARAAGGGETQIWLHLTAEAALPLECQRCLAPVETALQLERSLRFVHGEDAAAQLDADSDDDVLALSRALDLRELVEDELLLALPIVPRHESCPVPLVAAVDEPGELADDKPNPFAVLAALKRTGLN